MLLLLLFQAVEDTELRHSEQTTLWLTVIGRNYTGPTPPPVTLDAVSGSEKAFRVATIVLGVLFGLILLILVFFVVCSMKGNVRATPVLPRAIGKLSTDSREGQTISAQNSRSSDVVAEGEGGRRIMTLRKTSGDSGVDFIRSLSSPNSASAVPALRSFSSMTERDPDVDNLAETTEIDYNQNEPGQRHSGISTISGSEVVPYEDQMRLVGSAERMGVSSPDVLEESVGVSNPVYTNLDEGGGDCSVDVSVIPMEQAHITV